MGAIRRPFIAIAIALTLAGSAIVTHDHKAEAHTYYTCGPATIGGGGYISVWRDTVGGWTHYRANTFWVHENQYRGYWGCGGWPIGY